MDENYFDVMRSGRNWTDDSAHENGNYINRCCLCKQSFIGHKRRVVCFQCAFPKPTLTLSAMHIRIIIYILGAAIFLVSGFAYGFREILPFLAWALPLIAAGELGVYLTRRKHRNDK